MVLVAAAALTATAQEFGVSAIHSPAEADARLIEVAQERAGVDARFADNEQLCYTKFFVNDCLSQAREKRRAALAALRAREIEANHFKRAYSVAQRDQALAEQQKNEAIRGQKKAPPVPVKVQVERAPGKASAQRQAEHDAKVDGRRAQDAFDAGKRAANTVAFEKKQRESAERQRDVAARQAAKQAEKMGKDAAAAAASK